MKKTITTRSQNQLVEEAVIGNGLDTFFASIISSRTNDTTMDYKGLIQTSLRDIPHPALLLNAKEGANRIADAIVNKESILAIGDYDADGITGTAVISQAIKMFGVHPNLYKAVIGHRLNEGYGITQPLCDRILSSKVKPCVIITTDLGSSDQDRIKQLNDAGIDVIVTDHHEIPVTGSPASAYCTINPASPMCNYPDDKIAGCMVAWLVMNMVNIVLHERGFEKQNLFNLLDYVALGTIGDSVSLCSITNRAVVNHGLTLISKESRPCWKIFSQELNLKIGVRVTSTDIAFKFAPRINARGRLDDPFLALTFLIAESETIAIESFRTIEADNNRRKSIADEMQSLSLVKAKETMVNYKHSIVVSDESFHPGVQGIVASRLTETYGVPSVVLSPTKNKDIYTGSVRTVENVHTRDLLQEIDDLHPETLIQFGGHKGAAGLKIKAEKIDVFRKLFNEGVEKIVGANPPAPCIKTDGSLTRQGLLSEETYKNIELLEPFGQEFDYPVFHDTFVVKTAKFVGRENPVHLKMDLINPINDTGISAIWFSAVEKAGMDIPIPIGAEITCVYTLDINEFNNKRTLQLLVREAH